MDTEHNDLNIIEAAKVGDEMAWCHLFNRYSKVVWAATSGYNFKSEGSIAISRTRATAH